MSEGVVKLRSVCGSGSVLGASGVALSATALSFVGAPPIDDGYIVEKPERVAQRHELVGGCQLLANNMRQGSIPRRLIGNSLMSMSPLIVEVY